MKCVWMSLVLGFCGLSAVHATDYTGKVGKLEAVFSLDWAADGSVAGAYHYPAKPGVRYALRGSNPSEGKLYLEEFTDGALTARCHLVKRIEDGRIVWEGTMANMDGRRLPMSFSRARGEAAMARPPGDYEIRRKALLASTDSEVRWDSFPMADTPVEMVPVHLDDGEAYGGKVLGLEVAGGSSTLRMLVGDWDADGNLELTTARELTLRFARVLPIAPEQFVGSGINVFFAPDGTLFSLDLMDIAITDARRSPSGKLEVRGMVDLYSIDEGFGPDEVAAGKPAAPVVQFVPDKLALDREPADGAPPEDEDAVWFQTVRLVRDFGLSIQSTSAGPGSIELEGLSLDSGDGAAPWIPLKNPKQPVKAPPSQSTNEAG